MSTRTGFRALNPILGGFVARGYFANGAVGRTIWMSRATPKALAVPWSQRALMSQLRAPRTALGRLRPLQPKRAFRASRPRRADAAPNKSASNATAEEPLSLSARLKKLSREYGWTAVGVYLALSVLDFPFCFLLVRTVGTEKIAHLEYLVVSNVQKIIPEGIKAWWREYRQATREARRERTGEVAELEVMGHGVEEAEQRNKQEASLATQLALAYAIHKSFIFVRVPLTAAVTPKVVKVLRSWGWQIGKRKAKR